MKIRDLFSRFVPGGAAPPSTDLVPVRGRAGTAFMRGGRGVTFAGWRPSLREARNDVDEAWELAAARSTDAIQNSGWLAGMVDQAIANTVGTGLRLKAPAGYLRTLPSQIVAEALTYGIRWSREAEELKLYSSSDDLLAATGPDYGRIYDAEVVEAVMQVAGNGTGDERWKIPGVLDWRTHTYDPLHPITPDTTTLFASDRDVFIFLVDDLHPIEVGKLPSGDPDLIFRGFYVSNSEVGRSSLRLAAFYLRGVCGNRILWGVEGFEEITMRHSKYAPSHFIEQARPALTSYANGSVGKLIEGVEKAKAAKLASDDDEMMQFLAARKMSRARATAVMEAVEREEDRKARTAWDVAQGITAVARNIPNTDERVEFEFEAKKLLDKVAA